MEQAKGVKDGLFLFIGRGRGELTVQKHISFFIDRINFASVKLFGGSLLCVHVKLRRCSALKTTVPLDLMFCFCKQRETGCAEQVTQ